MNLFSLFLPSHQSFSILFFFTKSFLLLPPLGLVTHFSLLSFFDYPFTFLTCFSQLASLPVCVCPIVASVAPVRFWVSWTDRGVDVVLPTHTRSAPYLDTGNQARVRSLSPRKARKPGKFCSSAPLPSPCPRCDRDHKPNGLFTLVVWFFCIPPTTWAPCMAVDTKQSHEPCC